MSVGHNGINVVRNGRVVWEPNPCGTPHHNYPETLCTEPAGHYRPDRDPHAGPLIIDGREIGGAAWDEPKETRMTDRPSLEDLDAPLKPTHWCCNGNAEDCALCIEQGFDMLSYPWICPGHPRTPDNERMVEEKKEERAAAEAYDRVLRTPPSAEACAAIRDRLESGKVARRKVRRQTATQATGPQSMLSRYRDWLADQVSRAEAADQVGGVPPELRVSPHNGMASGLRTALLGVDRFIEAMDRANGEQP